MLELKYKKMKQLVTLLRSLCSACPDLQAEHPGWHLHWRY